MEDILRRDKAFNWSDEDIKSISNSNDHSATAAETTQDLERNAKGKQGTIKKGKGGTSKRVSMNSISSSNKQMVEKM
jgi:predicted peptidase